jgi:hypothetical protein
MCVDDYHDFQRVLVHGLMPRVLNDDYCVSIVPEVNRLDARFCIELGVMVMHDKPILAIVQPSAWVPDKLTLVADHIIFADIHTEAGQVVIRDAIERFTS